YNLNYPVDNIVQAGELTLPDTTETDETTGAWSFTDLGPLASGDKYYAKHVRSTGWTQTFGKDGYVITPTSGTDSTTNNFANFENFDISGTKYTDVNGKDASTSLDVDDTAGEPGQTFTHNLYDLQDPAGHLLQHR